MRLYWWDRVTHKVEVQALKTRIRILEAQNIGLMKVAGILFEAGADKVIPIEIPENLIQEPMVLDERPLAEVVADRAVPKKCEDPSACAART